jgi:hypothetical protein
LKYDATHHFPHAHCSQFIFEKDSLVYLLFFLFTLLYVPQLRALEMWRGVVERLGDRLWRETHLEYEIPRNRD